MNKLDEVRALFPTGAVIECVENTYTREKGFDRAGMRVTIERSGKTVCDSRSSDGKRFRTTLPTRVGDVLHVDGESATWRLDVDGEHTVTWRLVQAR